MADHDKPPLSPEVCEEIADCQYTIDKMFWRELQPLRHNRSRIPGSIAVQMFSSSLNEDREPSPPPQPIKLCNILKRYAVALFNCEYSHYPDSAELSIWRAGLAERTEVLMKAKINEFEQPLNALRFHCPLEQMLAAIRTGLKAILFT